MPVIIPPGYAQVIHRHLLAGDAEEMLCTYGVSLGGPGSVTIANDIKAAWNTNIMGVMFNGFQQLGVTLRVGQDGADPIVFQSSTAADAGLSGSSPQSQNNATLVKKVSALGGRRNRGRMYVPGIVGEADVTPAGVITPATVTSRQNSFNVFLTALNAIAGVGNMVILHGEGPFAPADVVSLIVDGRVATQRQRLRR
jgi:hypothetical protein